MNARMLSAIERYLAGGMSPEEAGAFLESARGSREALAYLGEALVEEAMFFDIAVETKGRMPEPVTPRRRREVRRLPVSRPWTWRITGIAAAVLVALGAVIGTLFKRVTLEPAGILTVRRAAGEVYLQRGDSRLPIREDSLVLGSDTVITGGRDSRVVLVYADSTALELRAETSMVFDQADAAASKRARVQRGEVLAEVVRQPPDRPMVLTTPHAEVRVVGTRFTVSVHPDFTRVDVAQGQVHAMSRASGQAVALSAGQRATIGRTLVVSASPASPAGPAFGRQSAWAAAWVDRGLQALYTFEERGGRIVRDLSGVGAALDLEIRDPDRVRWLPGGGLAVNAPTMLASAQPASKIVDACRATGEVAIEAWIKPYRSLQGGPARIVTLSTDFTKWNVMLGTEGWARAGPWREGYLVRLRSTVWNRLSAQIVAPSHSVRTELTHVVFARDASGAVRLYLDGRDANRGRLLLAPGRVYEFSDEPQTHVAGDFSSWDTGARLALANEFDNPMPETERFWLGEYHLVAIYSRALAPDEIRKHYEAGLPRIRERSSAVSLP